MIYAILYILCIIAANLTASTIIELPIIQQFGLGTLFFGPIFTLRDIVHQRKGKIFSYKMIAVAVIVNIFIGILGAFDLRILLASVVAMALSELMDTKVFHEAANNYWYIRVLQSNIISIPLDTILFTIIAFYGIWDITVMIKVIIGNIVIKFVMALVTIAVNYNKIYQKEGNINV